MSLYPFPARGGDSPPPVPPKIIFTSAYAPTVKTPKPKKNIPSLSKAVSFESFVNLYTSRNNSPTKQLERLDTSPSPTSIVENPVFMQGKTTPILMGSQDNCYSPDGFNSSPKLSCIASARQRAKGVFMARRKGSTIEAEVPMATVQEYCMDSPTIPGRPAICQEQGYSSNTWRQCAFGEILLNNRSPTEQSNIDWDERHISLLALPPSPHTPWSSADTPPPVPSKSPIIPQRSPTFNGGRLFTEPRPVDIRSMERPIEPYPSGTRYLERPPSPVAIMQRTREHYTPQRPRADSAPPPRPSGRRFGCGNSGGGGGGVGDQIVRPGSAEPVKRQRRRVDSTSDGSLPSGVRPSEAPTHFAYSQLELLRSAAKLRSEKFCVLNARDVEGLSKELSALDARCQYLRETHRSLRTGRRTLHTRMLTYLRSTRSAALSRDNLLKQEEALAELDSAIDDWRHKLEKAEKRRARVREKLLEHVAAALTVSSFAYSSTERGLSTPPTTPERRARKLGGDKESITIYALLADVEQEILSSGVYQG